MKKLLILAVLLTIPAHAARSDDQGYTQEMVRFAHNGHYYFLYYGRPVTRGQASDFCLAMRMFLVTINDQQEQIFLNAFRISKPGDDVKCWIGLQRACSTCDWLWDDGTPFCPVDPDCYWGFFGDEGDEVTHEFFACMARFDLIDFGLWQSTGNGWPVALECFACEGPNPPPVADAGQDRSVIPGTLVTLDGSNSSDPDGDEPLNFAWEISERPEGSTAVLDDLHSAFPSFTADVAGSYEFTLVVRDTYSAESDPDQVRIEALSPQFMVEAFIQEVEESADLSEATKNSLVASLEAALRALDDSNTKNDVATVNALEALVNKLEAQRGKKIPAELATYLIERAQDILTVLGG